MRYLKNLYDIIINQNLFFELIIKYLLFIMLLEFIILFITCYLFFNVISEHLQLCLLLNNFLEYNNTIENALGIPSSVEPKPFLFLPEIFGYTKKSDLFFQV